MNAARLRSLFDEYLAKFPNERTAIPDDDNVWRFERAAVKSAVEEFVRTTGGNQ